jgi:hypothetical protein
MYANTYSRKICKYRQWNLYHGTKEGGYKSMNRKEEKNLPKDPNADGGSSMKCKSKPNWANAILLLNFRFS